MARSSLVTGEKGSIELGNRLESGAMMDRIAEWLSTAAGLAWNYPVVILCLGAGIWFTFRLLFVQVRGFVHAIRVVKGSYDKDDEKGHISHLQALSAAVSATVGLGNIAGVAIAVALGGPGAVFWMWVIGFVGMATKFVECGLGTVYREEAPDGTVRGGPMYYIRRGLGESWAPMAGFFALACMISSFGIGNMFQSNQAATVMDFYFDVPTWVTGSVLAVLVAMVILGGIKRIGKVAGILVPFMCVAYVLGGLFICVTNIALIPDAFRVIITDAFSGEAAAGGAIGTVIIWGVRRAIFSSEAGLGSAPMAHAAAKTDEPMRQGVVALLEPFIDTIVVCSITALIIVMSGYYGDNRVLVLDEPEAEAASFLSGASFDESTKVATFVHPPARIYSPERRLNASHYRFDCACDHSEEIDRRVEIRTLAGGPEGEERAKAVYVLSGESPAELGPNEVHEPCPPEAGRGPHTHMLPIPSAAKEDFFSVNIILEGTKAPELLSPAWEITSVQHVIELSGIELTTTAFDTFLPGFGNYFVSIAVLLFAFSTALTWSYYGETGATYLFGKRIIMPYRIVFVLVLLMGAQWSLGAVMDFSDLMMALMVVPNVIAILLLSGKVRRLTNDYFGRLHRGEFEHGFIPPEKHDLSAEPEALGAVDKKAGERAG